MKHRRVASFGFACFAAAVLLLLGAGLWLGTQRNAAAQEPAPTAAIYLPLVLRPSDVSPTLTPFCMDGAAEQPREWDPRLDLRLAVLISATVMPGECYWRLVKAVWYDEVESQGRHHIFVDTRDGEDTRQVGVRIEIGYTDGPDYIFTEAKPGELYAKDYAMFAHAPAYSARPDDGAPTDKVDGMGLGSIEAPNLGIHTSYGLIWRWTLAPLVATPSPTPTATLTATLTPTATESVTPTGMLVGGVIEVATLPPVATPSPPAVIFPPAAVTPIPAPAPRQETIPGDG